MVNKIIVHQNSDVSTATVQRHFCTQAGGLKFDEKSIANGLKVHVQNLQGTEYVPRNQRINIVTTENREQKGTKKLQTNLKLKV